VARLKAAAPSGETLPVLAADTLVTCDGRILGKPGSRAEAAEMLRLLSGRVHEVVTGVCLAASGRAVSGVERTAVAFARLSEADIAWYVATGEPMDKAGAYHVDGRGALFIERIEGSPSNVAGLPVRLVLRLARDLGLDLGIATNG
jgi:septum formation protein